MLPRHYDRVFDGVVNLCEQNFVLEVNVKGLVFFGYFPSVEDGFEYKCVFLFTGRPQVVLGQWEEDFLLFVVLGGDFDHFLNVVKFKNLFFPVGYAHEKLTDLAACFDLIDLRFVL